MTWLQFVGVMLAALIGSALGPYLTSLLSWSREVRGQRMAWRLEILREVNDLLAERYRRLEDYSNAWARFRNQKTATGDVTPNVPTIEPDEIIRAADQRARELATPNWTIMVDDEAHFQQRQKLRAMISSEFGKQHGKRFDEMCSSPMSVIEYPPRNADDPWLSWHPKYHEEWQILLADITNGTFR